MKRTSPRRMARAAVWMAVAALSLLSAGCTTARFARTDATASAPAPPVSPVKAISEFERNRIDALYQSAGARWKAGDIETCEAALQQILRLDRQHPAAHRMLADLYVETDRSDEAQQLLENFLAENPRDAHAHHALGAILEAAGDQPTAIEHFEQAAKLEPNNPLFQLHLAAVRDARSPTIMRPKTSFAVAEGREPSEAAPNAAAPSAAKPIANKKNSIQKNASKKIRIADSD